MAHIHSVYDSDTHFSIDPVTRVLKNEGSKKTMVIQNDHNSERFTFEIPRYVEGHDMSLCNKIEVHYINIDSQTKQESVGLHEVDDMQISPDSDDIVIFSWLISQNATKLIGPLKFLCRLSCVSDDGSIDYAWNTAVYANLSVQTGIFNTKVIVDQNVDVLEQWKNTLINVSDSAEQYVEGAVSDYMEENPIIVYMRVSDGYIQYSMDNVNYENLVAIADLKGENGEKGDTGEQGIQGIQGIQGEKGDKGEQGEQGIQGIQGEKGEAGTDGIDGISPTATVTQTDTGVIISITDANGTTTATLTNGNDGTNGIDGVDGVSPTASITQTDNGAILKVTDANGTTQAVLYHGDGENGKDGIGIQSIEQTTTSTEDNGTNVITVTLTNGQSATFNVKNGSKGTDGTNGQDGLPGEKGEKGDPGADGQKGDTGEKGEQGEPGTDGKSAYEYAQDGGYNGTETEFSAKLADTTEYLTKANPKGTGSFSMNRFEGSDVGENSVALGTDNIASGYASYAERYGTTASGSYSHTEGYNTTASGNNQHVQGKFNVADNVSTYAHIVGGGTSDTDRKNIHTLDWDGNAVYSGDVKGTDSNGNEVSLLNLKSTLDSIQVQNFYTGITTPSDTLGEDGDLYLIT